MLTESDLRTETRAIVAALRAIRPEIEQRRGAADVSHKAANDIVTATDVLVQDRLQEVLREHHSDVVFVGEEGKSANAHDSRRHWLVDPICGTTNYALALPWFATNVALVEDGTVTISAVADGATGEIWIAERGRGAARVETGHLSPIHVARGYGIVSVDPGLKGGHGLSDFGTRFALRVIAQRALDVRVIGSTIALAYVATGHLAAAVYASAGMALHVAAGALMAQEAGALVTDETGAQWTPDALVLIASAAPELHEDLRAVAAAVVTDLGAAR